ncbi:MAG TPA: YdcH family protein [Polyangia bacterium]|nr:YdcH family protein [Polyangia bacterium]
MEKIRVDLGSAAVQMVQLKERHGELERRLAELERHLSLTPDEQIERIRLKKEKLRTKDELQRLSAVRAP